MIRHRVSRAVVGALVLAFALSACKFTGFGDAPSQSVATQAKTWLASKQQADGGFELAGFPGFETPDATLAIAEQAQTTYSWNATAARNAVLATTQQGHSPLHALDNFADSGIDAGQAAKLIVLDVVPLGLSPTAFDPDGDGAVNLVATLDAGLQNDGSYGTFSKTLYAALAKRALGAAPPAATIALIRAAQENDGGWNFTGTPTPQSSPDIDTTALAVQALVAAPVAPDDPALVKALAFLAANQQASGAWQSFGADDPNSTSTAVLALTAAGYDVNIRCWRDVAAPSRSGEGYANPLGWLRSQQVTTGNDAGHIASPNDSFGLNTFATSQSVQALERNWLPLDPLPPRGC